VTLTIAAINFGWLLPCAFLASKYPSFAAGFTFAALAPMAIGAWWAGAGRAEA
jgi:hypothetical protein